MRNNSFFDFSIASDGIFIISTNASVRFLIESLKNHFYTGKIILVEDTSHPLPFIPNDWTDLRVRADPSSMEEVIQLILSLKSPIGCVVSWHHIFEKRFIDAFKGRLLNVHTGDLPNFRGAGGGSWQILHNTSTVVSHVQQLVFEVDRGPILFGEEEALKPGSYPKDVKMAGSKAIERLLVKLGLIIAKGKRIELLPQDEQNATYFPRLNTSINGWLDFSWDVIMIERFVRAFSYPYDGAAFCYIGSMYRTKKAWIRHTSIEVHPFSYGLIVNTDHEAIHVACHGGIICLGEVFDKNNESVPIKRFKLGKNISVNLGILQKAKGIRNHPS